jgi:hypothetical protein
VLPCAAMRNRHAPLASFGLLLAVLVFPLGCDRGTPSGSAATAAETSWSEIQNLERSLSATRARLVAVSALAADDPARGPLDREEAKASEDLNRRLVAYLNANPPRTGAPLSPHQTQAIQWKTELDRRLAQGYLDHGDPARAIEILEAALVLDPQNQATAEALVEARARRYVTAERFALVKEGMTTDEVERALGVPNPHDVRELTDKGVVAWFYPKDASGAAAAVWFEKRSGAERGEMKVYRVDFEAIGAEGSTPTPTS